jgi:hypothetical protein
MAKATAGAWRPLASRSSSWAQYLATRLTGSRVTPNQISPLSITWGCWVVHCSGVAPMAGLHRGGGLRSAPLGLQLARQHGRDRRRGNRPRPERSSTRSLGWLAALLAVFTAYVRVLGDALGQPQDFGGTLPKTAADGGSDGRSTRPGCRRRPMGQSGEPLGARDYHHHRQPRDLCQSHDRRRQTTGGGLVKSVLRLGLLVLSGYWSALMPTGKAAHRSRASGSTMPIIQPFRYLGDRCGIARGITRRNPSGSGTRLPRSRGVAAIYSCGVPQRRSYRPLRPIIDGPAVAAGGASCAESFANPVSGRKARRRRKRGPVQERAL